MTRHDLRCSDWWPCGISDGLTLDCAVCGENPHLDYIVSNELWDSVVPEEDRRGVVCLPCLDKLAHGAGWDVSEHLDRVQWCGIGKTVELWPGNVFVYEAPGGSRARNGTCSGRRGSGVQIPPSGS